MDIKIAQVFSLQKLLSFRLVEIHQLLSWIATLVLFSDKRFTIRCPSLLSGCWSDAFIFHVKPVEDGLFRFNLGSFLLKDHIISVFLFSH